MPRSFIGFARWKLDFRYMFLAKNMVILILLLDFGSGLKYNPCRYRCKKLGIKHCGKVCKISIGDSIKKSCFKGCSPLAATIASSDPAAVLRGCIQQCKTGKTCELASKKAKFVKIVDNLLGAEGPVFSKDGNFYMVATIAREIHKIDLENKQSSLLVAPTVDGLAGAPVGCQCDPHGNIWVADALLGLLRVEQNGSFQQIATEDNMNEVLQGLNDLTFDYHGTLWITAPMGPIGSPNYTQSDKIPFGSVYCYKKTTNEIIKVATGFLYPNGIAVQHDRRGTPKKLIFTELYNTTAPLWSYDIVAPCQIENKQVWGNMPENSMPDGVDFDAKGNLIVADYSSDMLYVFDKNGGAPVCQLKCPFIRVTNVHFKPDSNELYITEREFHGLWRIRWNTKGMKQYCELETV